MSIKVMNNVWQHSKASGSALLVLLAIADYADDEGTAFPSVETLSRKARMSARNVQYVLQTLEETGELAIEKNAGPRGCNLFRVQSFQGVQTFPEVVKQASGVQSLQGCNRLRGGVKPASRGGAIAVAPEPSLTVIEPSKAGGAAAPPPLLLTPPEKKKKASSRDMTVDEFLTACKAAGEKPIGDADPILEYARKVGLAEDWIVLAWDEFKRRYRANGKRQKDWRATFRSCVRGNWYRIWWINTDGVPELSQVGKQAERAHAA